ncbi:beta-ketoacyl-[acyl-carrier-protein] synthase family protein [Salinisphaera sp. USBA-960]|nr:beta-ketoacyl-[acyl-carrier-protein] synthase family protein [Salifodinibacter halophilus]NNC25394.1 beta-ketoacyl-[acyl-carrier-protein] synthase family protein [Salifodinibacter halophilus]
MAAFTATTALGCGVEALWAGMRADRDGLSACDFDGVTIPTRIGRVHTVDNHALPAELTAWDCRNNRLADLGLAQDGFVDALARARARYADHRIGVFMGTSTSGIGATEAAFAELGDDGTLPDWFCYEQIHAYDSLGGYLRARLGLTGPGFVVSTACSSSAKVFAAAKRWMDAGLCDAALVGGVDSLCRTTLHGFNSLQLVSAEPCRPGDVDRDGLSIGEAAGFALLVPNADAVADAPRLAGAGESSDAYHMASPDPTGAGAALAMTRALDDAGLTPEAIGYCNLHGTATPANDVAEAKAVARVLGSATPVASTKGWTGHTLGAAGVVEAVIALLAAERGWLPHAHNTRQADPELGIDILTTGRAAAPDYVMSNAFGFGGSNASLIFERGGD